MTALVPTIGHKNLIEFAKGFVGQENYVHVILSSRSHEPIRGVDRIDALYNEFKDIKNIVFHHHDDDNAPQTPKGDYDDEFWDYWVDVTKSFFDYGVNDILFASELYGVKFSNKLGIKYIPFDVNREHSMVNGTNTRKNILLHGWNNILPLIRRKLISTVTIFGPESCGKTTMAKRLGCTCSCRFVPEWARQYLETVGPEVSMDKMRDIVFGQSTIQSMARMEAIKPITVQDTDLLSTIGYYRLWNGVLPEDIRNHIESLFNSSKSDLYIIMNDQIPFEADPLRYGVDKRETTNKFWIDLLEEYGCDFYIVRSTDRDEQYKEVFDKINEKVTNKIRSIMEFERD